MEAAEVFGVSVPLIKRWLKLRRQTGDVEPKPVPGPRARKGEALEAVLPGQEVRENPDATLEEHRRRSRRPRGCGTSSASVSRALKRLGLPLKKSPSPRLSVTKGSGRAGAGG